MSPIKCHLHQHLLFTCRRHIVLFMTQRNQCKLNFSEYCLCWSCAAEDDLLRWAWQVTSDAVKDDPSLPETKAAVIKAQEVCFDGLRRCPQRSDGGAPVSDPLGATSLWAAAALPQCCFYRLALRLGVCA